MRGGARESDERLLDWLALSDRQVLVKEIAAQYDANPRTVEQAMYLVRRADREAHVDCPEVAPRETTDDQCHWFSQAPGEALGSGRQWHRGGVGTVEAFVTMGACDTDLMFGHLAIQIPPGNDSEATFRKLVDHVFKGVPGFRFGIVIGRELLA